MISRAFSEWLDAVRKEGLTKKAAILASVFPLESAAEAQKLRDTYAEFCIPDNVIERLKKAGNDSQERKAWPSALKPSSNSRRLDGLRGIHILSGGKEAVVPELCAASGL